MAIQRLHHETGKLKDCLTNGFTGNRAGVNADTSDHGCPVNDGDALVRFCRCNGPLLSRRTAADNDKVIFRYTHFRASEILGSAEGRADKSSVCRAFRESRDWSQTESPSCWQIARSSEWRKRPGQSFLGHAERIQDFSAARAARARQTSPTCVRRFASRNSCQLGIRKKLRPSVVPPIQANFAHHVRIVFWQRFQLRQSVHIALSIAANFGLRRKTCPLTWPP
jgi:hypothetical protein